MIKNRCKTNAKLWAHLEGLGTKLLLTTFDMSMMSVEKNVKTPQIRFLICKKRKNTYCWTLTVYKRKTGTKSFWSQTEPDWANRYSFNKLKPTERILLPNGLTDSVYVVKSYGYAILSGYLPAVRLHLAKANTIHIQHAVCRSNLAVGYRDL